MGTALPSDESTRRLYKVGEINPSRLGRIRIRQIAMKRMRSGVLITYENLAKRVQNLLTYCDRTIRGNDPSASGFLKQLVDRVDCSHL